jgi:sorbitol-specific phosphotransferase system component IIBC
MYTAPDSTQATRDAAVVVFQAFHRYVGVAVGEHLGYLFTSIWTVLVCMAILGTQLVSPLLGWLGILPAIGVFIGVFEETGFKAAGAINAISYLLWSVWLIAFGAALLLQ